MSINGLTLPIKMQRFQNRFLKFNDSLLKVINLYKKRYKNIKHITTTPPPPKQRCHNTYIRKFKAISLGQKYNFMLISGSIRNKDKS